jgi:hypothetical protein
MSMNNYFTNVPLLGELRKRGIGGYRAAKSNLRGFPKVFSRIDIVVQNCEQMLLNVVLSYKTLIIKQQNIV